MSKHRYVNTSFFGGLDCAWLAAFAEWTLCLDVEICEPEGSQLFRSRTISINGFAQVTIALSPSTLLKDSLIKSKATVVPNGQTLVHKDPALRGVALLNWQSSWSTILHDCFHHSIDFLLGSAAGPYFATYLDCIGQLRRNDFRGSQRSEAVRHMHTSWLNHPVNPLLWARLQSPGFDFLRFATRRLPELASCQGASRSGPIEATALTTILIDGRDAMNGIQALCPCLAHRGNLEDAVNGRETIVCLRVLAETIVIFLWILCDCDIDEDIRPSITGLATLYAWQSQANKSAVPENAPFYEPAMSCDFPALGIDLIFHVFTGLSILDSPPKFERLRLSKYLALAGNGLCVYFNALEDPNLSPENLFRIRVVSGSINHSGFQYKELIGFKDSLETNGLDLEDFHGNSAIQSVQTIVQETEIEARLEIAYLLHYYDKSGIPSKRWLHLPYVFRKLQIITRSLACPGNCPPLSGKSVYCTEFRGIRPLGPYRATQESVNDTQHILDSSRSLGSEFVLKNGSSTHIIVIGSQRLLLYALLCRTSSDLMPITNCLTCILSNGHTGWCSMTLDLTDCPECLYDEQQAEENGVPYKATFITSNHLSSVVRWVRV